MLEATGHLSCEMTLESGEIADFCTNNLNPRQFVEDNLQIMKGTSTRNVVVDIYVVDGNDRIE